MDHRTWRRHMPLLALAVIGCGGGGGSGSGVPVVTTPTPAPTPTPTATPAPTPTPASPATVYAAATDFTRDRFFQTFGATIGYFRYQPGGGLPDANTDIATSIQTEQFPAVEIGYTAATEIATLSYGSYRGTFAKADITQRAADRLVYLSADGATQLSFLTAAGDMRYVAFGIQYDSGPFEVRGGFSGRQSTERRFVVGDPTVPAEVPRSGATTYRPLVAATVVGPSRTFGFAYKSGTLRIDHGGGTIGGTLVSTTTGNEGDATLRFVGMIDPATNRIRGTIDSPDSDYTGTFYARLFGPAGGEIGIIFTLSRAGSVQGSGAIVGRI